MKEAVRFVRQKLPLIAVLCGLVVSAVIRCAHSAEAAVDGERLASELGCVQCHSDLGRPSALRQQAPDLSQAGLRYRTSYLLDFLQQPRRVRQNIGRARMPDFHLDEREALALALFLEQQQTKPPDGPALSDEVQDWPNPGAERNATLDAKLTAARQAHPEVTPVRGEQLFRSLNCAACHRHVAIPPRPLAAPGLASEGFRVQKSWLEQYLRKPAAVRPSGYHPGDGSRMPGFRLLDDEARALAEFLMTRRSPLPGLSTNAAPAPLSAFSRQKAVQLLQDKFACLGCHRLGDRGGVLGPDLGAVAVRLQSAYVQGIIADPRRVAPHSIMPQIPMPPESVDLLTRCLLTGGWPPVTNRYLTNLPFDVVSPAAGMASPDRSAGANYLRHCAACHGVTGRGDGWNASFLTPAKPAVFADPNYLAQRPDDTLFDGIHSGARVLNRSPLMPPWGTIFSGTEIRELVRHLRTLCRCDGPEWSRNPAVP